ncbi:molybdopterin-dependent oxidoreductase [Arcobacter sp. L]|uniref:molybdopterin-dependent oxidoreductase n=1 Tax=Arcobacter sp. L TaxID=944547 RepID=UPI0002295912|nr:molybdopterin-dependent oxidoreductase [Arcobacter sp. L]BAK71895.1 hypothetical protein ABLL_0020 [Arcobacter sp. L]
MKKLLLILLFLTSLFSKDVSYETNELKIEALVEKKLVLNMDKLQEINDLRTGSKTITLTKNDTTYEGVLLKEIIDQAKINVKNRKDLNKVYIMAIASDNYKVLFSWNELFNSKIGDNVLIFLKKNGKLLDKNEGKLALISVEDINENPRHIKWLEKIIVNKID